MRKKLVVCVITALCLFVSASPWEGAAATAPEGELPGKGRYIATNSFPRNTVVDIVNIETNKSTRVIVAGNLDSPGLLAIVSREAAELIGMRPGSVCRIRMTQPSDPVAYVRFTEGLSTGIPDYDSGDVITEERYNEEFVNPAAPPAVTPPNRGVSGEETAAITPAAPFTPAAPPPLAAPDNGYPAYVLEPEWSGAKKSAGSARDIIDLPPINTAQEKKPETPAPVLIDEPETITGTEPETEEITETIAETEPEAEKENTETIAEAEPEAAKEIPEEELIKNPEEIAEAAEEFDDYADDLYDEPDEIVEYNIVPSDNRPPASIYGIDPAFIIPSISSASKTEMPKKTDNPVIEPNFSIPRIYELTRGSYYVQLAAFDTVESVENGLNNIDRHYKPVVFRDSDKWYRILLGPLNQGESAAVLARFKSIGYKDAFVRVAR